MDDDTDYSKPFRAIILEDCRNTYGPAGSLTGQSGVCLGMYKVPDNFSVPDDLSKRVLDSNAEGLVEKLSNEDEEVDFANPLILSESGDYIWGAQCYFSASEDLADVPIGLWLKIPEAYRELLRREFESRQRLS